MNEAMYNVYYTGALQSGFDADTVSKALAGKFNQDVEKAGKIINGSPRIFKSKLPLNKAQTLADALTGLGMIVEIHDHKAIEQQVQGKADSADLNPKTTDSDEIYPFAFHGKGMEYFKIWIVNIVLTVLTLGIYSAWAKVRNQQYFYGNTELNGSSFQYTASPITILKGRIIAVIFFVIYSLCGEFIPLIGGLMALMFIPLFPWLVLKSLSFNARNSVYRGVPFNFVGQYAEAFKVFILWPLILIPTLGLALPYIWYRQNQFMISHSAYGTSSFGFSAEPKDYWQIFIKAFVAIIVMGLVGFVAFNAGAEAVVPVVSGLVYLFVFAFVAANIGNLNYNSSNLDAHGFDSTLETKGMAWLYVSNTIAIALSVGLLIPWAKVRMANYKAKHLIFLAEGSMDKYIAAQVEEVSALGEQISDVFDMEVSII